MSEANSRPEPTPPAPPPEKNYLWIYYFVFLVIASVAAAVFMILYNLSIQLKPEELEAAQKLWQEIGPKSYDMVYTEEINSDKRKTIFAVKVRAGKVTEVLMNGKPLEPTKEDGEVHDPRPYHSMDAKFREIIRFMDLDQKKDAPKVYVTANFDPKDGHIERYVRNVMGTTQRVELNIKLEAVDK
jgi:hypothetical protein